MAFRRIAKERGSSYSGAGRLLGATLAAWYFLSTTSLLAVALDGGAPRASAPRPEPVAAGPAACHDHPCCCATSGDAPESCCCLRGNAASDAEGDAAPVPGLAARLTYLSAIGCAGPGSAAVPHGAPSLDRHAAPPVEIAGAPAFIAEAIPAFARSAPAYRPNPPDKVPIEAFAS